MALENMRIIALSGRDMSMNIGPDMIYRVEIGRIPRAASLQPNELLVQVLCLPLDPAMFHHFSEWGHETAPKAEEVMASRALVRVLASTAADVLPGALGIAMPGWINYAVVKAHTFYEIDVPETGRLTDGLGVLGTNGIAGYFGMLNIGYPMAGETVVVSAAAGPVGSIAAQAAKHQGAKVIGITETEEQRQWLERELGLYATLSLSNPWFMSQFNIAVGPGIDVYYDNVGGNLLDIVLAKLNRYGRIALRGTTTADTGPKDYFQLAVKSGSMRGVNVPHLGIDVTAAWRQLASMLNEGSLKRSEKVIKGKLENAPRILNDLLTGIRRGYVILDLTP